MVGDDGRVYYLISDLHIGGDEQLEQVDFLEELLAFLERLERTDEDAELIINGDAFGLWEFTTTEGLAKFDELVETYPELFAQFRATGENVTVTLLPGNHDHELAVYDEYVDRFAAYNVDLVQRESLTRPVGGCEIWVEHGMQRDPNNRIEKFGSPNATPLGYHVNRRVTSRAGRLSNRGRYNWLKDIQAVTPVERIPTWLVSKYFYREMNPVLRYASVPFLLLFNISIVIAMLAGLALTGVWSTPLTLFDSALGYLGPAGPVVWLLLAVNVAVVGLLATLAVPSYLILRDVKVTLDRFGVLRPDATGEVDTDTDTDTGTNTDDGHPDETYLDAAREVFADRPQTAVFCYGHTHRPSVTELDDRLVVNTGTWLKRLHVRDVVAGVVPPVFQPSFHLSYVRVFAGNEGVVVEHEVVEKPDPVAEELTLTERLLTVHQEPDRDIPARSVVTGGTRIPPPSPGADD
jgi:UDP-2,3-diacylglucosamine pyrophosphatase LpxH